jgi:small conductance mechanosensitive channel
MNDRMEPTGPSKTRLLAAIVLLLWAWFCTPAFGQSPPAEAPSKQPSNSVSELERLVGTLQDEGKGAELITTLRALIEADRATPPNETPLTLSGRITTAVTTSWTATRETIGQLAGQAAQWPQHLSALEEAFADPSRRARNAQATAAFVGIFIVGWLAEWASWKVLAGTRRSIKAGSAASPGERTWKAAVLMLLDLITVAIFAAAAYSAALVVSPPPAAQAMALNFVHAYAIGRGLMAFARAVLSPALLSLLSVPHAVTKNLLAWARRFVAVGVGGYFLIAAVLLLGVPRQATDLLINVLYFILAALAVAMILQHRHKIAAWIGNRPADSRGWRVLAPLRTMLSPVWHILAILYVIAFFAVSAFDIEDGFLYMARGTAASVLAITLTVIAVAIAQGGRRFPRPIAAVRRTPASLVDRLTAYAPVFRWLAAASVGVIALLIACEGWGIEALAWLAGERGRRVLSAVASIALTFAFAILAWEAASSAIQRYMAAAGTGEPAGMISARGRTLLPLLQKTLFAFLSVMVVLISLSEIGIDITPLLAGAGVAGLAIGFGAQRLVQDVSTGFFMLVEDAVAVGDVVAVAGVSGVVEDMSVRALKLRDVAGALHTVPFSTVSTVTNMTKNFSYYVLDIAVADHEDPDEVADVCRAILDEMRQEPAFAASILEPLEVFGLDSFGESAIVVKARIKTVPIKQWFVGREFNKRMKQRFDALGIEFPFSQRTVYFGNGRDATAGGPAPARKKEAAP